MTSASPSRPLHLEYALHNVAPAEQQLALVLGQVRATSHKPLHHGLPAAQLVLQQEVVERGYQFRLVADESIRKVVPQYLAALAVKARLPGELQQLPLQLCAALHQARDRCHTRSLPNIGPGPRRRYPRMVNGYVRHADPTVPCFDSDMDGCGFPPMNRTDR